MKVLFYRYGSICEPDLIECFKAAGIEVLENDVQISCKDIKASDAGAKVIMCSAMGQQAMVIEAIQSGAKDFIVKPFQADRVIEAVKKVVG